MKAIIIIIVIFALIIILFITSENKRKFRLIKIAREYETNKDYANACYHYAIAGGAGMTTKECENKVRQLWQDHGPFDFSKQLKELQEDFCEYKSCGQGFHELTIQSIQKMVNRTN